MKRYDRLSKVKVGDEVIRYISASQIEMPLKVTDVTEDRIVCGAWQFDRQHGYEIDEELGWGKREVHQENKSEMWVVTGSVICVPPDKPGWYWVK